MAQRTWQLSVPKPLNIVGLSTSISALQRSFCQIGQWLGERISPSPQVGRDFESLLGGGGPDGLSLLPEADVFGAPLVSVVEEDPAALVRAPRDVRIVELLPDDAVLSRI